MSCIHPCKVVGVGLRVKKMENKNEKSTFSDSYINRSLFGSRSVLRRARKMSDSSPTKNRFYTPDFKQSVLEEYKRGERGSGFVSLAKRFKINGGKKVVSRWYDAWDGSVDSLKPNPKGHRSPALSKPQVEKHLMQFVAKQRKKPKAVSWNDVQKNVKAKLNKDVPLSTLRNYGHAAGVHVKRTREVTEYSGEHAPLSPPHAASVLEKSCLLSFSHVFRRI